MLISPVPPPALPDLRSALRVACPGRALVSIQERGTARDTDLDRRAHGITLDVDHGDRGKMLGGLVRRLAGSLHLFDTGVGQQDHERGVVAPVLSPGRDQVLPLQIPAYAAELLVGQLEVLQQPAAADMGHPASLGRFRRDPRPGTPIAGEQDPGPDGGSLRWGRRCSRGRRRLLPVRADSRGERSPCRPIHT